MTKNKVHIKNIAGLHLRFKSIERNLIAKLMTIKFIFTTMKVLF